jgi:hypothetical protein
VESDGTAVIITIYIYKTISTYPSPISASAKIAPWVLLLVRAFKESRRRSLGEAEELAESPPARTYPVKLGSDASFASWPVSAGPEKEYQLDW